MNYQLKTVIDLAQPSKDVVWDALACVGDSGAHSISVKTVSGGQAVDTAGCSAAMYVRRQDEAARKIDAAFDADGYATATLDRSCYEVAGSLTCTMQITDSDSSVISVARVYLMVGTAYGDAVIDPSHVIPNLGDLLAEIDNMRTATGEANTAAGNANAAAFNANSKASAANTAAGAANTAAGAANTAAGNANAAANKLLNLTAEAAALATGQPPSAVVSERDGHLHLALGLPRGLTGATPQITFDVTTGAPGSDAQVTSITGTAEHPVIHMTIPRGDTGDIGNLSINGKSPVNGSVTLTAADVGARADDWLPTPAQIGAYPADGIRRMAVSIAVSAWAGSGPYTHTIAESSVTANTYVELAMTSAVEAYVQADIAWETSAGKIALSTAAKPTGTITGTLILTEVDG